MKTQTSKSQIYCPMAAIRYARVLYEVGVPKEAVQKTREIFEEVPQLHEIFANPTIELQKKMNVVDRVFPKEIRNFLKVACRYQRMNLIEDIFTAYDRYCDEQNPRHPKLQYNAHPKMEKHAQYSYWFQYVHAQAGKYLS